MKRISAFVSILAITLVAGTSAQAACNQSHVNNKTWKISAHEVTTGALLFCTFRTSGAGTIALTPNSCEDSLIGVSTDFKSPTKFDIASGAISAVRGANCTYDATLNLVDGSTVMIARVVMESGKTIAVGNFLMTGNQGGTIAMMRQ